MATSYSNDVVRQRNEHGTVAAATTLTASDRDWET